MPEDLSQSWFQDPKIVLISDAVYLLPAASPKLRACNSETNGLLLSHGLDLP